MNPDREKALRAVRAELARLNDQHRPAALTTQPAERVPPANTAKQCYDEMKQEGEEPDDPVERLRFFCSLAMRGEDWLDVEPFFDAILAVPAPKPPTAAEVMAIYDAEINKGGSADAVIVRTVHAALASTHSGEKT